MNIVLSQHDQIETLYQTSRFYNYVAFAFNSVSYRFKTAGNNIMRIYESELYPSTNSHSQ